MKTTITRIFISILAGLCAASFLLAFANLSKEFIAPNLNVWPLVWITGFVVAASVSLSYGRKAGTAVIVNHSSNWKEWLFQLGGWQWMLSRSLPWMVRIVTRTIVNALLIAGILIFVFAMQDFPAMRDWVTQATQSDVNGLMHTALQLGVITAVVSTWLLVRREFFARWGIETEITSYCETSSRLAQ